MNLRSLLNLGLLAVAAGLGVTVWLSQKKDDQGPPLTPLQRDAITRIAVEHPGKPTIRLEKHDGRWQLTAPVQADTDKFEVGGILELAGLEVKSRLDAGVDKKELELDPPQYSVTLDDVRIDLGGTEPIKYRRYVASGGVIGLVDDPPSAALDADYSDLVSKSLLPEGAKLSRVELPGLSIEKSQDGQWRSPQQPDAQPAQVARLAEAWQTTKSLWNAAEPPEGSQGDAVTLTLDDGRRIALVVQAREPQLVLARKDLGLRYTLSKALIEDLFRIPPPPPAKTATPPPAPAAPPAGAAPAAAPG